MDNFKKQNNEGKKGEKDFIKYCKEKNFTVEDKTEDNDYQKIDVDFIVNGFYTELKTDNLIHKTNNFPIELTHHRKTDDKQGWFFYCQAFYVIRYSPIVNRLYILYFDRCKGILLDEYKNKQRKWWDTDGNYVTGLLLNVDELIKQGYLRIIDM